MEQPKQQGKGKWSKAATAMLDKHFSGSAMDYKQTFGLILPIFADQAFLVLMSLLNTAMVSSSGVAAVSAVSLVDSLNMFIVNIFLALAAGGTVIVAQYKGSGDRRMVSRATAQAIALVAAVSVVISVLVVLFHNGILNVLFGAAEEEVFSNARIYLVGVCLGFPLLGVYQAINGAFRGIGATKISLYLSLVLNMANFLLNVVFILLLDMGVVGLVISLLLSKIGGLAAAVFYLSRHRGDLDLSWREVFRPERAIMKKITFIGVPFALEQLFFNGGKLLTQTYIVQFGTLALTANAIAGSISGMFQIGANALAVAAVTVVGQSIGRKDVQDARKYVRSFSGLSVVWYIAITAIVLPLYPYIVRLFSPPEEIVPTIFTLLVIISIAQPTLWAFSFLYPAALRAAGDAKYTSLTALLTMWIVRVVLGYVLGVTLGFGVIGVWIAMVIEWGVRGFFFWLRFRGEKWFSHKLI